MSKRDVTKQLIKSDSVLARMAAAEVKIYWDSEWQEYTVTTPEQGSALWAYPTDDRQDAIDTAHAFLKEKLAQLAIGV